LKNLVTDKPSPITTKLAQKSDGDNVFAFDGSNVTRGNLKNLVTDKPSPITTKLAQKSDGDNVFAFDGSNVTRGNLKNLVTDKPSPITTKLAQKSDGDNVFAFDGSNVTRGNLKNLVTDKPSPITTKLAQLSDIQGPVTKTLLQMEKSDSSAHALTQGVPVQVNPVVMQNDMASASLDMNIKVGPDDVTLPKKNAQKTTLAQLENPVVNPPFNNWSVNQPSPPHQHGLDGKADLGQNILVDGHPVHFAQR
jgi:hypothetical protein